MICELKHSLQLDITFAYDRLQNKFHVEIVSLFAPLMCHLLSGLSDQHVQSMYNPTDRNYIFVIVIRLYLCTTSRSQLKEKLLIAFSRP